MAFIRLIAKAFVYILGSTVVVCAITQSRRWWWIGAAIGVVAVIDEFVAYFRALRSGDGAQDPSGARDPSGAQPRESASAGPATPDQADAAPKANSSSAASGPAASSPADGGPARPMALWKLLSKLVYLILVFVILACAFTQRTTWWWIGALIGLLAGADDIVTYVRTRKSSRP